MKVKKRYLLLVLLVFCVSLGFAQERTITGKVVDKDNLPLPGATVLVKNTSKGTSTDFDGVYSIKASQGETLVFSFVGYASKEITVGSSNTITAVLAEDAATLEEVVVVAYGSQTKKSVVGSIAEVSAGVIEKQQVIDVTSSIQGSVPGVNIISSGGQPGNNPTIRIRGVSSINASASPLIIVDGAPFNGNINTISADQIKSINVLKDASSTSLYGSRGANGVILIVTKKGNLNSAPKVSFRSTIGIASQAVDMHDITDTDTFTRYTWEAMRNASQYEDGNSASDAATFATNNLIPTLGYNPYGVANPVNTNGELATTEKLWDTDWTGLLVNNAAVRKEHALSISGGGENTSYFFSGNYLDQEGSINTSDFERVTTRLSVDTKVNNWLSAGLSTFYSTSKQNVPDQDGTSFTSTIQWRNNMSSYYPLYRRDQNGALVLDGNGNKIYDYGNTSGGQPVNASRPQYQGENIVGSLFLYDNITKRDNFTANAYLKFQILENLSFKTQVSYEKYILDTYEYNHNEFGVAASVRGRVDQDRDFTTTKNITNAFNYQKSFGDHNFSLDAIHEAFERNNDELGAQGAGFLPDVKVLNGSTTPESISGSFTDETLESYLARLAYNYDGRYFLEGSFRTDGSSRFAEPVRWGNFFSVGGSWVISDENFLSDSNTINLLKLRASYGELGNNRTLVDDGTGVLVPDYFPYLSLFNTGENELDNTGVLFGLVTDEFLTWEKTSSTNIGLDFALFGNTLYGSIDYYNKESVDLIYDQPLAISTGNESIKRNIGALRNYGLEVTLNANLISTEKFSWSSSLNFSFDNNEITELTQESFINGTKRWEVGRSLYEFFMPEWAGVNPDNGYAQWYVDVLDGEGNPTGEQTITEEYSEASRNYVNKSSLPDVIGGFNNSITYGPFDLNVLFNFSFGSYVYDSIYAGLFGNFETAGGPGTVDYANRWQQPGDITDVPLLLQSQNDFSSRSDRFLFKNDYVRLKALTLGYTLPNRHLEKFGVSRVRVFFQGDNLLTFQSHKGIDPEQSLAGTTNNRSYNQKVFSFGVNLDF
ncbi:SusC/RagA family TonB-linked outer membrane protein [Seonamhaeicola marinus]|uniref:TonB-dependent receptor n=1 Tax=Seonamhaeicola marinus TaxID=1912246 RepID=A0A5D0HVY5_9FLAO|nr:TonB-dependent receptor [Seonamhaeicola marinus]TYA74689.1 TonB-dependent receptor [Seonamhaeicola marinus]